MNIIWNPYCDCKSPKSYNVEHDSYYCNKCDKWLEPECNCKNNECGFNNRPKKPSLVKK